MNTLSNSSSPARRGRGTASMAAWFRALLSLLLASTAGAADNPPKTSPARLADLSIEELMNESVTSVSRREQKISDAPAAIHVITAEDIRRSGMATLPELLRTVPGLDVAQINAGSWAIASRGFNSRTTKYLLVLIDGRSVYSLLNSGVSWEAEDVLLEDVDRIEVIRGPGATLWGANAVNGVINITTKSARDTQGVLVTGGGGSEIYGYGGLRYGGQLATNVYYRVYTKYYNHGSFLKGTDDVNHGADAGDRVSSLQGGLRLDWEVSPTDSLTFQGDYFDGTFRSLSRQATVGSLVSTTNQIALNKEGNFVGRWRHAISESSSWELQLYYDHLDRNATSLRELRDTVDLDFSLRFPWGERQDWVCGLGYRYTADQLIMPAGSRTTFNPTRDDNSLVSAFLQDEITVAQDRLFLTLGTKLEADYYAGFEIQPSARLLWKAGPKHIFWSSVARAARSPNRRERDVTSIAGSGPSPPATQTLGNHDFGSEHLLAYEVGYRFLPKPQLSFDLALFYNVYDDLRTSEARPAPFAHLEDYRNLGYGETYGGELSASWRVTDQWRLTASYTGLQIQLHRRPGSNDASFEQDEGFSPHHQIQAHSFLDLPHHLEFDMGVYYVDRLPALNVANYVRYDVGLGWRPTKNFEARVSFQDLLDASHPEFGRTGGARPTEVQRSVWGKLTWRF